MHAAGNKNGYDTAESPVTWSGLTPDERREYIDKYSPLIKYVADRMASRLPPNISREDLISSGVLGLIDAVDKFDPSRNIKFKTYAEFRVKGAMLDELRSLDWVPRSIRKKAAQLEKAHQALEVELGRPATEDEICESMGLNHEDYQRLLYEVKGVSVVDFELFRKHGGDYKRSDFFEMIADEDAGDALEALGLSEARDVLAEAIDGLPERERLVVTLYYYEELTMKEIGEVLDYSESRISQIHTQAVVRLRTRLRRYFSEL